MNEKDIKTVEIDTDEKKESTKKSKSFVADYVANVYAFFEQTSSTGNRVGLLEVNSSSGVHQLKGENFNWDEFVSIFNDTITLEMIKDLIINPNKLRIPVGEQFEGLKNYYKIERLTKKEV